MSVPLTATVLFVSNDASLSAAARRDLQMRRPEVRVSSVSCVAAALLIAKETAASVILLAEEVSTWDPHGNVLGLQSAVQSLVDYAPVVVLGRMEYEPCLSDLIAAGSVDYVPRAPNSVDIAIGLVERRLIRDKQLDRPTVLRIADASKDFGEVLRHELNNPLTGILGNAELLLAEISLKNDGRLPRGGQERVETIAALAVRLRETVRQLSQEWESRQDPVR